jgi:hypothetical protein
MHLARLDLMRERDEFRISGVGRLQSDKSRHPVAIAVGPDARSLS